MELFTLNEILIILGFFSGWIILGKLLWPRTLIRKGSYSNQKVSIIIPVRNEEYRIAALLETLKQQGLTIWEILFIDDDSDDGTAELIKAAGFKVYSIPPKPADWVGKTWALWQGAKFATGDYFLFLDADVWFVNKGLEKIFSACFPYKGVVTVFPYHRMIKLAEKASIYFNLITLAGEEGSIFNHSAKKQNGLFGPCFFCSRHDYFAINGHESVKNKIVEDLAIGQEFTKNKIDIFTIIGRGIVEFRMYPGGIKEMSLGWKKNIGIGARKTKGFTLFLLIFWITAQLLIPLSFVYAGLWAGKLFLGISVLNYFLFTLQFWILSRRIGNLNLPEALFFLAMALYFLYIYIQSTLMLAMQKPFLWKNRYINSPD
ncbi:MAG: glycosyltransferase family 2 protein [Spirochaetales bacterium]|nr:glycosyltransferase family 2 protein [Spirochaetales bacterium]